jgi:hypothetical protein
LVQHVVTNEATGAPTTPGAAFTTGRAYRFKLEAFNEVGSVTSTNYAEIVAASVPDAPAAPPAQDFALTDGDRIHVTHADLTAGGVDGGSPILGYDLWRDDGAAGDYVSLFGAAAASESIVALAYTDLAVSKGVTYRYQYRARNINGWGGFSGTAFLYAAARPSKPAAPKLLSLSDTQFQLGFTAPSDTGGTDITAYQLYIDAGAPDSVFSLVTSFAGTPGIWTHTMGTSAPDSLTAAGIYRVKFRATNAVGYSEDSEVLRLGLGAEPPAMAAPSHALAADLAGCGPTFVAMTWPRITTGTQLPVLGYIVQMVDPTTDEWVDVFDASSDADAARYVHYGAVTGETYHFRVFAVNFNGRSTALGNQVAILACGLPLQMDLPTRVTSSGTTITIKWTPPADDGGCAIYDYAVRRTPGSGTGAGTWVVDNPTQGRGDPGVREYLSTMPGGAAAGAAYLFTVEAINRQGSVVSPSSAALLAAGVPAKPAAAPLSDGTVTSGTQIKVTYGTVTDNGGSAVLSYELQRGSTALNDWVTIAGLDPHSLALEHLSSTGVITGATYTFKYRANNAVGSGPWSDTLTVRAAGPPSAPPKPSRTASDATSITLSFAQTGFNNGGSEITSYELLRDDGSGGGAAIATVVTSYLGAASSH